MSFLPCHARISSSKPPLPPRFAAAGASDCLQQLLRRRPGQAMARETSTRAFTSRASATLYALLSPSHAWYSRPVPPLDVRTILQQSSVCHTRRTQGRTHSQNFPTSVEEPQAGLIATTVCPSCSVTRAPKPPSSSLSSPQGREGRAGDDAAHSHVCAWRWRWTWVREARAASSALAQSWRGCRHGCSWRARGNQAGSPTTRTRTRRAASQPRGVAPLRILDAARQINVGPLAVLRPAPPCSGCDGPVSGDSLSPCKARASTSACLLNTHTSAGAQRLIAGRYTPHGKLNAAVH